MNTFSFIPVKKFSFILVKKYLTLFMLVIIFSCAVLPDRVSADTGPKPSVAVKIEGLESETYYVTLLSAEESSGPWGGDNDYGKDWGEKEIRDRFAEYTDEDGFFFLGYFEDCSDSNTFEWNYYAPEEFKILIYFPEYDSFAVSANAYERYAFDSYYTVKISDEMQEIYKKENLNDIYVYINVEKSYDYPRELFALVCRVFLTIIVELFIALLFGFRNKRQIRVICITNIVTQLLLNVLLNLINYKNGFQAFTFHYVWMELLVFAIEGAVFCKLLRISEENNERKMHPWLYAFVANATSFIIGMILAKWLPQMF